MICDATKVTFSVHSTGTGTGILMSPDFPHACEGLACETTGNGPGDEAILQW